MANSRRNPSAAVFTAMVCAGAVNAQFIAGKATRDALYLGWLDVTSLPVMVIATAAFSILLVAISSLTLRRALPGIVVPVAFAINAVLLVVEWALAEVAPAWTARAVYLQVSGLGPMLGSGFWLIATELFDPRTARKHFGQIAGVGTLSGLVGALVAERMAALFGVISMLPVLAAASLLCAWQIRQLALAAGRPVSGRTGSRASGLVQGPMEGATDLLADSPQSGLRALSRISYLRNLAALVVLGTIAATLADYVFKVRAVEAFQNGDWLLRFFAMYYAATSLLAFVIQTTSSTLALEKLGLAVTASTPSIALVVGGLGGIVLPGLQGALLARSGESVFRGSLFRTGYELFFTPIPSGEKRAAKSIIDVGFDRLGDAVGGGLIRVLILLPMAQQETVILLAAVGCSGAALVVARQLNQGYIHTLERNLINRAVELDLGDVEDMTTRSTMLRTIATSQTFSAARPPRSRESTNVVAGLAIEDPEIQEILALRSRDRDRILAVLRDEDGIPGTLVPHVIPLLAWDPVAEEAARALRRVMEEHVGELTDVLIDANQPFAVRRRLARVFGTGVSQRAADGLLLGLEDLRFEVRFQ
jgi:ATP:ADP antiporter, AAA family